MRAVTIMTAFFFAALVFSGSVDGEEQGNSNTFFGTGAGVNTTGDNDAATFIGASAGNLNTGGAYNTFVGNSAGYSNTAGGRNTFIGREAGYSNDTGSWNTFLGTLAGYSNTTGQQNTFLGHGAGHGNNGSLNTFIGDWAGRYNTDGSGNVFLGRGAGYSEGGSNKLYIANSDTGTPLIYGEFDNKKLTINGNVEVIGPDNGLVQFSNVRTDYTAKGARMVLNHYSNVEKPVYLFGAYSGPVDNFVAFGGGNAIGNDATQIDLFTAENNVTAVGSPRVTVKGNGYIGIGTQVPSYPLQMAGGAYSNGASWLDGSSREYKEDIETLSTQEALEAIKDLNPVKYAYRTDRTEKRVGFIAEDVPDLVATKDRKGLSPMDIVAVLTKVLQEQQITMKYLTEKLAELEGKIESLQTKESGASK